MSAGNLLGALALLRDGSQAFNPLDLAGPRFARLRARIMSELTGARVPQAKSGVTAIRSALHEIAQPAGDCIAVQDRNFSQWARDVLDGKVQP